MELLVAFLRVPGVCVEKSGYLHSCSFFHGGLSKLSYLQKEKQGSGRRNLSVFFFFLRILCTDTLKISHYLHMIHYFWSRPYSAPSLEMYSSMLWSSIKIENQFEQVRDSSWRRCSEFGGVVRYSWLQRSSPSLEMLGVISRCSVYVQDYLGWHFRENEAKTGELE